MGCDIHLHTEVKIGGKWHHYGNPSVSRSYMLFAKMAGVRNCTEWNITPIDDPRGLPEGISDVTRLDYAYWGSDAHSASWLSASEILQLEEWLRKTRKDSHQYPEFEWGYLFGNSFGGFTKYPTDNREYVQDVRFVFWFDN